MDSNHVYQHFQLLSNEMLERERASGKLLPEAQKIADEEFERRQSSPSIAVEHSPDKKKTGLFGLKWWEWIIVLMIIRGIYKFLMTH